MTTVWSLKDKKFERKEKVTYQLEDEQQKGVDDGCIRWTICLSNKGDGSALIENF